VKHRIMYHFLIFFLFLSYLNCIPILQEEGKKFDPTTLPADKVSLELEIGSSVMFLYGSWLRHFFHLKVVNYFNCYNF